MSKSHKLSPPVGALKARELMPGDVVLGAAGDQLRTLLGSCVSVILTDPRRTVGAMCHIVHVGRAKTGDSHNTAFGVPAMHEMFRLLQGVGIVPRLCHAFVYGGGNLFPDMLTAYDVGGNNAAWVMRYLRDHGISVVEQSLGGAGYRKVSWAVGGGDPVVEMVMVNQEAPHGS